MSHAHLPPALLAALRRHARLEALAAQAAELRALADELADEPDARATLDRLAAQLRRHPCSLCQRGAGCDGPC